MRPLLSQCHTPRRRYCEDAAASHVALHLAFHPSSTPVGSDIRRRPSHTLATSPGSTPRHDNNMRDAQAGQLNSTPDEESGFVRRRSHSCTFGRVCLLRRESSIVLEYGTLSSTASNSFRYHPSNQGTVGHSDVHWEKKQTFKCTCQGGFRQKQVCD